MHGRRLTQVGVMRWDTRMRYEKGHKDLTRQRIIEVASGHQDSPQQKRTYLLLPTARDVLWIGTPTSGQQPTWTKLHRVP